MISRVRYRMSRPRRSRAPKAGALAGAALLAGIIGVGGWAAYGRQAAAPEKAELTSTPKITRVVLPAPPAPPALQEKIEQIAERFREPVGIAVTDVSARWTAQVAGEEVFPQQSVSKLWVALAVMQAVDRGALRLDQPVTLTKEDRSVFYQPITTKIRGPNGYATTVYELLKYQLTESDNAANDKLIQLVGGGAAVSRTMAEKGLDGLGRGETERDLQTRAAGLTWKPEYGLTWVWKAAREELPEAIRDQALAEYLANPGDGARPASITNSLAALKRGELLSPQATETMLDLMAQCRTGSSRLRAGLPSGWSIAHKTGTGPDWRGASVGINDVGLLTAPDGRTYAVAVMMRQTRHPIGARNALMQAVARTVVDYWRTTPRGLTVPDQRVATLAAPSETAR